MSAAKETFYKRDGRIVQGSKEVLKDLFAKLPDGAYTLQIAEKDERYTPTRYRYYFGHVVPEILSRCGHMFRFVSGEVEKAPVTGDDMHMILKSLYNPMTVIAPGGRVFNTYESTTNLNDRDFAGRFVETIIADFSNPPYLCEFAMYDDWREMMRQKNGVQVFPV